MKVSIDEDVLQNLLFRLNQLEMVVYGGYDIEKAQAQRVGKKPTKNNDERAWEWVIKRNDPFCVNDLNKGCRAVVNADHARKLINKWLAIGDIEAISEKYWRVTDEPRN